LITYSSPCQDFSVAGLQKGGDAGSGTRSSLLWECERIIRAVKPKYLLMENVKNLVGKKHKHNFIRWLRVLEMMGYQNFWKVLNAKDYGVPQNRERVFVVSILGCGQYLFPNPKKLEKRLKDVLETKVDKKYYLSNDVVDKFLKSSFRSERDKLQNKNICDCLRARDWKSVKSVKEPLACASRGRNPENPSDRTAGAPTEQRLEVNQTGCSNTLTSVQKDNYLLEPQVKQVGNIVETDSFGGNPQCGRVYSDDGISPTLNTMQGGGREPKITDSYCIRKLTPRECWRLMGVKDEQFNKLHGISNSQLYKLAGNSIVVDVLMGIFKNLFLENDSTGQLNLFAEAAQ
jgi:DNA (cytosine-5)-methyltransferase 1